MTGSWPAVTDRVATPALGAKGEAVATAAPARNGEAAPTPTLGAKGEAVATPVLGAKGEATATPAPGVKGEAAVTPTPGAKGETVATPALGVKGEAATPALGVKGEATAAPAPGAKGEATVAPEPGVKGDAAVPNGDAAVAPGPAVKGEAALAPRRPPSATDVGGAGCTFAPVRDFRCCREAACWASSTTDVWAPAGHGTWERGCGSGCCDAAAFCAGVLLLHRSALQAGIQAHQGGEVVACRGRPPTRGATVQAVLPLQPRQQLA